LRSIIQTSVALNWYLRLVTSQLTVSIAPKAAARRLVAGGLWRRFLPVLIQIQA
jgi:hypothetical protein